jgi:hypothetical protein
MTHHGYVVTETIDRAHRRMDDYQLMPGDLLVREKDGSFWKECPGMSIGGFHLTDAQIATLRETEYEVHGLTYVYDAGSRSDERTT